MQPQAFWRLTHWELQQYLHGCGEAEAENLHRLAVHAAWIMNVWLDRKSKVTASRLLGKEVDLRDCRSSAEFDAKVAALRSK